MIVCDNNIIKYNFIVYRAQSIYSFFFVSILFCINSFDIFVVVESSIRDFVIMQWTTHTEKGSEIARDT